MTIPQAASPLPNEDGVRYERVDALTVNVYVEGTGDPTVRPPTPARVQQRGADRANIERLVAWAKQEQEKLNALPRQSPQTDDANEDHRTE